MLEDVATDAELETHELEKAGLQFEAKRVDTREAFARALKTFAPDVVLCDYTLPDYNGRDALKYVCDNHPEIPVVMVSGALGDEAAIDLLHAGAKDYVLKDNLARLPSAVERAISVEHGMRARKAAERALRDSNKLLATAERIAHIGGWQLDVLRDRVEWSEETYRIFGRDPSCPVRTNADFLALVHPDDRGRVGRAVVATIAHGAPFATEFRIVRPDGTERIVSTERAELTFDAAGNVAAVAGTCHDVTEARRAERLIREEEAKFRGLVEQNVAGVAIVRDDGTIGYVNPYFAGLVGCEPAALVDRPLLDFVPDSEKAVAAERLKSQFAPGGGFVQIETKLQARDDGPRDILVNASPGIFEGKPASIAVVMDITERKRAEQELRDANIIVEQSPVVLFRAAATDGFPRVYVSQNISRFGYTVEEAKTGAFAFPDYIHPDDRPAALAALGRVLRQETELFEVDYRAVIRDGSIRWIHDRTLPLRDSTGKIWAYQGTLIDITERKAAEQRLEDSEERFRLVIEQAPDAIVVYDYDRDRFVEANKAAERLFGCGRDELLQYGPPHFYATEQPDSLPLAESFAEHNRRVLAGEELKYERRIRSATGEERLCEVTLIRLPSPSARLMRASFVDVTERRHAEQTLHRLNRTLRTLSRGNEVVVRATEETELMTDMCRTIVEAGGYRVAWIGAVEHDDAKSVKPVAWAGETGRYLEEAHITWAEEPRGNGPHGRAIRSGAPQITQDLAGDPSMAPWREEAGRCGFASSIVLPLKNPEVFAALIIYAGEPDAFDGAALKLLQEMADDLAYGIRALRDRSNAEEATHRWQASLERTIEAIASTVDMRDPYTAGHQRRVAQLAVAIGRALHLPDPVLHGLYLAGVIHDVGKVVTPAEILNRPGKLTSLEFQLIQAHAEAGYDIVKGVDFPWPIAEIVRQHHERIDGSGYPRGLQGEEILREARILAVADVVEAMVSHRPYRPALGLEPALAEIEKGRGRIYDAAAVDACLKLFRAESFHFE